MAKITNTSTVSYKYTLPDQTQKEGTKSSNVSATENMTTSFKKVKSANKEYGLLGDTITLSLVLTNDSEYNITNVKISDTIDTKSAFQTGSVKIDGTAYADYDPALGFELPNEISASGGSVKIEYEVVLGNQRTGSDVYNFVSDITYSVNEVSDLSEKSNVVTLNLIDPTITITKSSDKTAVVKGSTINYTNVVKNTGNLTHTEVQFSDQIPAEVTFVAGSVKINNETKPDYDPSTGFALGEMAENTEVKVEFAVTVN